MSKRRSPLLSLIDLCIEKVASNTDRIVSLKDLPEELVFAIFEAVLSKGKLTPRLLELFWQTEHELVLQRVKHLKIQWVPPVLPTTRNPWLHEKPGFY